MYSVRTRVLGLDMTFDPDSDSAVCFSGTALQKTTPDVRLMNTSSLLIH